MDTMAAICMVPTILNGNSSRIMGTMVKSNAQRGNPMIPVTMAMISVTI